MKVLLPFLLFVLFSLPLAVAATNSHAPGLMLANTYRSGMPLSQYWVSEKLDGVRAYWDGRRLRTRSGYAIKVPDWFIADFPDYPMDGELWVGRGQFHKVSRLINSDAARPGDWKQVNYMIFDLPAYRHEGKPAQFEQRKQALIRNLGALRISWLKPVHYFKVETAAELMVVLRQTVKHGGEGLMLNRSAAYYRSLRSDDILKLKPRYDAEAVVLAHLPGRGKYEGLTGALLVQNEDGVRFKVGSGLKDDDRREPPAIGSTITYGYSGKTHKGKPRFPRFLRQRISE